MTSVVSDALGRVEAPGEGRAFIQRFDVTYEYPVYFTRDAFAETNAVLVEAINILGSIFYGVLLGLFLVAFFLRRVGGSAVFFAALTAQTLVILMYFTVNIGYLWYNLIGCAACVILSLALQALLPRTARRRTP